MKRKYYITVITTDGSTFDVEDVVVESETQFDALKQGMAVIEQEADAKDLTCVEVKIERM